MRDVTLQIDGMSCGHCLNAVNQALHALPGVEVESVQMGKAQVRYDESMASEQAVTNAVEQAGYHATVV